MILPDGTVVPEHFGVESSTQSGGAGDSFSNFLLRPGEVDSIVYPDDPKSLSKSVLEYRVLVRERANGTVVSRYYDNCVLSNCFGGLADQCYYTFRYENVGNKKSSLALGSKVLLLCVNGEYVNAIILGGLRDPKDSSQSKWTKDKSPGHYYKWIFNGVTVSVDDDGQYSIEYGGKTDANGELNKDVDEDSVGTTIALLKDGTFVAKTKDDEQYVKINHADHKIEVKAKSEHNLEVTEGKSVIKASDGVHVGDATDNWPLFSTYRRNEQQMHAQLQTFLRLGQAALQTAVTLPTIITALNTLSQLMGQMAQTISTFEQSANNYLSKKNKND